MSYRGSKDYSGETAGLVNPCHGGIGRVLLGGRTIEDMVIELFLPFPGQGFGIKEVVGQLL